ncbi:CBS domain-containing protein [Azospirillum sp.]|uniref:CBS domain-containing protein n=1 Tax=Azospirillum sp. TaxID=34012 RepID=UPI002D488CF7|nr:CBS domain-containing protein [Azospirillum sp.]HYD64629.1 CBS domain-containing protein [Azospirillum sp.]
MKVEEILRTKGTRINMVRVNETVETALKLMRRENIGALVVKDVCRTEGNTIVGVISERDVVRGLVDSGPAILQQPVSALMSRNPITCRPSDPVRHVLQLMDEHAIRHVPVLDGFTLVGVISVRDLIKRQLAEAPEEEWDYPIAVNQ